jgi:hypothetical protein
VPLDGRDGARRAVTRDVDWRPVSTVPPLPADLVDRPGAVARIAAVLAPRGADPMAGPAAVRIATIVGAPGSGKTTLAVRAAHQLTNRFPDGQVMVDLGGSQARPTDPADALGTLLLATGLAPADLPDGLADRSRLFRSRTAGRRLLVILDDAAIAQVAPLLPGGPGCAVLATSGRYGLPGGETVLLDPFDLADGVRMLSRLVGERRVRDDRSAAESIVRACGGVPLALRAIGTRLASVPGWPLREVARRLADPRHRLEELRLAGLDVPARYDAAYRQLGRAERTLLRLLGLTGIREFTVDSLVRLSGQHRQAVEAGLVRLVEHHLLQVRAGAPGAPVRYLLPELSWVYAQRRSSAPAVVPPVSRRAGTLRSGHLLKAAM